MDAGTNDPGRGMRQGPERGGLGPAPLLKRKREISEGPPFWSDLPGLFAYPLRKSGAVKLLLSSLFFAVVFGLLKGFNMLGIGGLLFGGILAFGFLGYIVSFFLAVVRRTIESDPDPPEWPEFSAFADHAAQFASLLLLGFVPLLLPVGAATWAAVKVGGFAAVAIPLLAAMPGLFYLPMAVLVYAVGGSVAEALNPVLVFHSIARCLGPYALAVPFVYAILAVFLAFLFLSQLVPFAWILFYAVSFYFTMLIFRLLGLFYLQCQVRLGWYEGP